MQAIDFWKLSDEFSVMHAALIVVGRVPHDVEQSHDSDIERHCPGYIAVRTALMRAIESGALKPAKESRVSYEMDGPEFLDVRTTFLSVSQLDQFFKSRGYTCEFFERNLEPGGRTGPFNRYFSKKLDAANRAWAAVTSDPARLAGKSPKQALAAWLTEHATELGLINRDGKPNQTGIDEICKVANWKPEGGATPTSSSKALPPTGGFVRLPGPTSPSGPKESFPADLDDEIPF